MSAATRVFELMVNRWELLAHKNRAMTEHYVKARVGERVKPLR